ncbi:MAG: hypothetical protein EOO20_14205 [Chryseobacterium sp.]|nr:MAG: hypothetical protein EOO20_14205 [Chryseobacterium sp.]
MFSLRTNTDEKYFKAELSFFLFVSYGITILNNLEYGFYYKNDPWLFARQMESTIVWGTFTFLFYGVYYWIFLKRFVFERKTLYLVISLVVFIISFNLYNRYVAHWSVANLPFLSKNLRDLAKSQVTALNWKLIITPLFTTRLFTIIGFCYFIRSLHQQDALKTMEQQRLFSELSQLKAQLQPHFFFNTLNNIYALAIKRSPQTAAMVAGLSDMMRYVIYQSEQEKTALSGEIDFLKQYLLVEKLRYDETTEITIEIQGDPSTHKITPLILLPLVENAFKHGLQQETRIGFLHIVIYITNVELVMEVTNSKPVNHNSEHTKGLGLENLRKRLDLLYGYRHQYHFTENSNKYHAYLTIDLTC